MSENQWKSCHSSFESLFKLNKFDSTEQIFSPEVLDSLFTDEQGNNVLARSALRKTLPYISEKCNDARDSGDEYYEACKKHYFKYIKAVSAQLNKAKASDIHFAEACKTDMFNLSSSSNDESNDRSNFTNKNPFSQNDYAHMNPIDGFDIEVKLIGGFLSALSALSVLAFF